MPGTPIQVQYVGPRSYMPPGSKVGYIVDVPGLSEFVGPAVEQPQSNKPQSTLLRDLMLTAVTTFVSTVAAHYTIRWLGGRK